VIPGPTHGEEALVPDHLSHDLKADPLQALGDFGGMDAGVPDVANSEGGYEFERLGPVDPSVPADGGVAMPTGAPTGALGRPRRVFLLGLAIYLHVRLLRGSEAVIHAVAPGAIEADAIGRIGRE
jgi:hypothetical protein